MSKNKLPLLEEVNDYLNLGVTPKELHDEHEAEMAIGQLRSMIENCHHLLELIKLGDNLEGWVAAKLTLAADYVDRITHYLENEAHIEGHVAHEESVAHEEDKEQIVELSTDTLKSYAKKAWADMQSKRDKLGMRTGTRKDWKRIYGIEDARSKIYSRGEDPGKYDEEEEMVENNNHKQSRLLAMISDYEQRAKDTKSEIRKAHFMQMADDLRMKLKTSEDVSESQKTSKSLNEYMQNIIKEDAIDYLGRKLRVKTTKGTPDMKEAPTWATALGQTPEGAWHWLEKEGPVETSSSDRYFPLSGKTKFSGFVGEPQTGGRVMSLTTTENENNNQLGLLESKKKPSAGMTKKEKSEVVKKAKAGKDVGEPGKKFEEIEKKAGKKYGSKEAGKKVAAAAMWKKEAKKK